VEAFRSHHFIAANPRRINPIAVRAVARSLLAADSLQCDLVAELFELRRECKSGKE
jgi:hypothetical protein